MDDLSDSLLPVLRHRWSPREFDDEFVLGRPQLDVLLEAARWAPSAGNSQPWAFHAAQRRTEPWHDIVACLATSSRPWAEQASVLIVNLSHVLIEDTEWEYSEFSAYDLGQAVAHMTIQAHAMGLACRQFRAFNKDALTTALDVPSHWQIMTMTAIGKASPAVDRGPGSRERKPTVDWPSVRRS